MSFFNNIDIHFYFAILLSIINGALLCFIGYKFLQILQLSNYKLRGYNGWLKDTKGKYVSRVLFLTLLSLSAMLVTNAVFDSYGKDKLLSYIGLVFYLYFAYVFIINLYNAKKKTPLKNTRRMNRLTICLFFISATITFGLIAISTSYVSGLRFAVISLTPILLTLLVPLCHIITLPYEELNKLRFLKKAKKKLNKMPYLIKIGITGSYGKTSTKYILNTMLSKKYSVCMSPHSFNTPMGITKVILKYLKPYNEVFIAEMGANQCRDIAYLCDLVKPTYGILTSVGSQHLRTFYSLNNIKNTKYELVKAVMDKNGYMVFNGDNEITKEFYNTSNVAKDFSSLTDKTALCYAENIKTTTMGTEFVLVLNGEKRQCRTKLLGEHNIQNILMSATMANKLQVPLDDIVLAIGELEPVPHRLELKEIKGINVLDDSFNSSVEGSKSALKVLSLFDANKIIITPGLVELGNLEKEKNIEFGFEISKVCNKCIIIGKANVQELKSGIEKNENTTCEIIETNSLEEALIEVIKNSKNADNDSSNFVILLENDLPDNYS